MEKGWLDRLEAAMRAVQRDVDMSAEPRHRLRLVVVPDQAHAGEELAFIALEDGRYWSGGTQLDYVDEGTALASVAEATQDCLVEVLRQVWPLCPVHDAVLSVRRGRTPTWWCAAGQGHEDAAVGSMHARGE